MNDFFNSKFCTDLKNGKLPTVEVEITQKSVLTIGIVILICGVVLIAGVKLTK